MSYSAKPWSNLPPIKGSGHINEAAIIPETIEEIQGYTANALDMPEKLSNPFPTDDIHLALAKPFMGLPFSRALVLATATREHQKPETPCDHVIFSIVLDSSPNPRFPGLPIRQLSLSA